MAEKLDQLSVTTLEKRYYNLFLSKKFADCSFKVENEIIKCHKLILSAASPVFEAMFYGPIAGDANIEIFDISSKTFLIMLEFIYTNRINVENTLIENIIELYYSADKYLLKELTNLCLHSIKLKLRFENILPTIELCFYMNLQPMLNLCMLFFGKYCANECQFWNSLKMNYYHLSSDCLKYLTKADFQLQTQHLTWLIREWCKQEHKNTCIDDNNYKLILNDLKFPVIDKQTYSQHANAYKINHIFSYNCVERVYFKACRPFIISELSTQFIVKVKTEDFISLIAIITNSRLMPQIVIDTSVYQQYDDIVEIEILSSNTSVYKQLCINKSVYYNCDIILNLHEKVILSPNIEYFIKFNWNQKAFGAEYPTGLLSDKVKGFSFIDNCDVCDGGSILKGLRYSKLDLI